MSSRMRQGMRTSNATNAQTNTTTARGSRMLKVTPTFGMGRGSRTSRSPQEQGRFDTPQKMQGSGKKFFTGKKVTQFDPRQYMVAECSLRDIEVYKQVFDFLDEDHDGNLTPLDLRKCIREFGGYNPGRKFVYIAMSVFDSDDGGQIDFREFVKLMTTKPYEKDTEDDLVRVFEAIDEDGKGYIDEADLTKLAEEMKEEVNIQQIRQALMYAAPEGKNKLDFKEFVKFCRRKEYD